jgi:hypothetical protein
MSRPAIPLLFCLAGLIDPNDHLIAFRELSRYNLGVATITDADLDTHRKGLAL